MVYVYTDEGVFSFGSTESLNDMVEGTQYLQTGVYNSKAEATSRILSP